MTVTQPSFAVLGVPSSAGAHWPGQEKAPEALRRAGLVEALGPLLHRDLGDLRATVFAPDAADRHARNATAVRAVAVEVAAAVARLERGVRPLVIGGDCTILIGVVAGLLRHADDRVGLVYLDGHTDLNTPATSRSGILDSMGLAHLLGHGVSALAGIGPRFPLLDERSVSLLGFSEQEINPEEHAALATHRCTAVPADRVRADPDEAVRVCLQAAARPGRFLVHFDVDVIDFTDLPVADVPQFGDGLPLTTVFRMLTALLADARCAGLVVTELNPDRDVGGVYAREFVEHLGRALIGGEHVA